jgi:glycosyltransferase involved in cell wall biosynthesis
MANDLTVIVPSYNRVEYLKLALNSALNQTVTDFDILVVDDFSHDGSVGMVEEMRKQDSRLRILTHSSNKGPSAARNTGISNSTSKYITFLDSDDLFAPDRVETLCARLAQGEERSIVYTDWVKVTKEDQTISSEPSRATYRPEGMIFPSLITGNFRFTPGLLAVPRKAFEEVGPYDESLRWAEDTDMALRLSLKFPFLFEKRSTYGWRSHELSSSNLLERRNRYKLEAKVLEKYLLANKDGLDRHAEKAAFDRLFGCYISARMWARMLRMGFVDRESLASFLTTPARIVQRK